MRTLEDHMKVAALTALTIEVVVVKGDAVGQRALVHPQVQVLLPPGRVILQVSQASVGLLLAHLTRLVKPALLQQLAHLANTQAFLI